MRIPTDKPEYAHIYFSI